MVTQNLRVILIFNPFNIWEIISRAGFECIWSQDNLVISPPLLFGHCELNRSFGRFFIYINAPVCLIVAFALSVSIDHE